MEARATPCQVTRRAEEVRTPGTRIDGARRILAVRSDRLGDLVLSVPAVQALRRTYPDARVGLMVRSGLVPLARTIRGVDEVLAATADRRGLLDRVRSFGADLAVCISRDTAVALAAARAGVPHRVGTGNRLFSALYTRRVLERRREGGRHECEYALSFAHRAGASGGPATFDLEIPADVDRSAARWVETQRIEPPFVLLHPGSGGSCPAWPAASYLDLAARLMEAGVRPLFSIGPGDAAAVAALEQAPPPVRSLPRFTGEVGVLAALLRRSAVVVSNSTGPLHLAAAVGTATLGFYPPWPTCSAARWGPYADNGWALVADENGAAAWSRSTRRRLGAELMAGIPVETAARCALDLLRGDAPRTGLTARSAAAARSRPESRRSAARPPGPSPRS